MWCTFLGNVMIWRMDLPRLVCLEVTIYLSIITRDSDWRCMFRGCLVGGYGMGWAFRGWVVNEKNVCKLYFSGMCWRHFSGFLVILWFVHVLCYVDWVWLWLSYITSHILTDEDCGWSDLDCVVLLHRHPSRLCCLCPPSSSQVWSYSLLFSEAPILIPLESAVMYGG